MFNKSKYTKWYYNIINNRKLNIYDGYTENHHIIPKCLGGMDNNDNIVSLSAREHYVCHLLLTKMINNGKINYAFIAMVNLNNAKQQRIYKINSRIYEYCKKLNSKETSKRFKGKAKHNIGKRQYYHEVTYQQIMCHEDDVPVGYILGSSPLTKQNQMSKNKGRIYYYHPITLDVIAIFKGEDIPVDYIKGNPKANTNFGGGGKKQYYNIVLCKYVRKFEKDKTDNDIIMKVKTIYNELTLVEKFIPISENIPDGWVLGRSTKNKHRNQYMKGK
jgi:hypothetical protein